MKVTASYDVFDTVVTRAFAHPRDLFVHLGTHLGLADPLAFAQTRWAAELAARKHAEKVGRVILNPPLRLGNVVSPTPKQRGQETPPYITTSPEVTFDEIYAELARQLGWDELTGRAAQTLELEIESRHLHAVPLIRDDLAAARATAGKLIFLSDQYLPPSVLRRWLEREGVAVPGDLVLMSGETRANKSSGLLFQVARAALGSDFSHWRHTGDHPFADVESPRRLGIAATHFTAAHLTAREWQARGTRAEFAPTWRSLLAGTMRLARLDQEEVGRGLPTPPLGPELNTRARRGQETPPYIQNERTTVLWETGATAAGPLFYTFVRWTLAEAARRGITRLYFLARDGQIFRRIAQTIQAAAPSPIECRYLHASRLLFAGPAELDSPAALRLLAAPTGQFHSRRQTLLHLNLADTDLPVEFRTGDVDANLPQRARDALADWLLAPEQRPLISAAIARRAEQARRYLEAEGVHAGESIAVVDTGWFGTIQRSLEHIVGAPLTGFYLGLMPSASRPTAGPALGFTNQFSSLALQREESHKVLIELFARSDHGPAVGFSESAGRITVRFGPPDPVDPAEICLLQNAILAFTQRALAVETEVSMPEAERARVAIEIYRAFHDSPSIREVRVLGFTPHSDQYLDQRHASLCVPLSFGKTLAALTDYRKRPPHWWIGGQAALGHGAMLRAFRFFKKAWWRLRGRAD